ncbi:hypothetical protein HanRHA438_Chr04g0166021 [Helianthus annuus]|nr:hypothetical protein HanRHA438_Chr04g0166021 [Helianthus annuus]
MMSSSAIFSPAMKNPSCQRIITPPAFGDAYDVRLRRHYRSITFAKRVDKPFSLIYSGKYKVPDSVRESTPSKLSTYRIVEPEMILLEKYVSIKD